MTNTPELLSATSTFVSMSMHMTCEKLLYGLALVECQSKKVEGTFVLRLQVWKFLRLCTLQSSKRNPSMWMT